MAKGDPTSPFFRVLWGVLGGGIAYVLLAVSGLDLSPAVQAGIAGGVGLAAAALGPIVLDVLGALG